MSNPDGETVRDVAEAHRRIGQTIEMNRWVKAMEELGFKSHPGLSVKENLYEFGEWWSRRNEHSSKA